MSTKEEILQRNGEEKYGKPVYDGQHINYVHHKDADFIFKSMDEYAKQEAFSFFEFKSKYQHIEGMNVRYYNIEKYGTPIAVSWIGAADDVIWKAYKEGKQLKRYFE